MPTTSPGMKPIRSIIVLIMVVFRFANDLQQNDRMENVIHIGTNMGLNFVIAGSVENKGTMIVTNCKVIGIEKMKKAHIPAYVKNLKSVGYFYDLGKSIICCN